MIVWIGHVLQRQDYNTIRNSDVVVYGVGNNLFFFQIRGEKTRKLSKASTLYTYTAHFCALTVLRVVCMRLLSADLSSCFVRVGLGPQTSYKTWAR